MSEPKSENIVWHQTTVNREARETKNKHKGVILWFTGLSGSGKSTVANAVENLLFERGCNTFILDGDNIRYGLNKDLGFSPEDRTENIRRIGEVANLFVDAGVIVCSAFISPYRADRDSVRKNCPENSFVEVYVECPLEICEQRDPKGLYKKARTGEISQFTGISAPYEKPENPEIVVSTGNRAVEEVAREIILYLEEKGIVGRED